MALAFNGQTFVNSRSRCFELNTLLASFYTTIQKATRLICSVREFNEEASRRLRSLAPDHAILALLKCLLFLQPFPPPLQSLWPPMDCHAHKDYHALMSKYSSPKKVATTVRSENFLPASAASAFDAAAESSNLT